MLVALLEIGEHLQPEVNNDVKNQKTHRARGSVPVLTGQELLLYREDDARCQGGVRLLTRQEFANDFVHDILRWEEIEQEVRQNTREAARLSRTTNAHPVNKWPKTRDTVHYYTLMMLSFW